MLKIRKLLQSEIIQLKDFPPDSWDLDLPKLISFHYGHSYFYPVAAEVNSIIVGCGIAIIHGTVSWLGTIIVLPEYRRKGIGHEITFHLMEYSKSKGCTSQLLIATELGEPVYRKLGFETSASYVFYKRESIVSNWHISNVREIRQEDAQSIKELDREITGEERFHFIKRFFLKGWVYTSEESSGIKGVYLLDFGAGLILAKDDESGIALIKLRMNCGKTNAIIPSTNTIGREFLISEGFQDYRTAPRMVLGNDVKWQPTMVYNRGAGYCG